MIESQHPDPTPGGNDTDRNNSGGPPSNSTQWTDLVRAELAQLQTEYETRQQACRSGVRHLPGSVAAAYHRAIEARKDALAQATDATAVN